jgi:hypothetical protein
MHAMCILNGALRKNRGVAKAAIAYGSMIVWGPYKYDNGRWSARARPCMCVVLWCANSVLCPYSFYPEKYLLLLSYSSLLFFFFFFNLLLLLLLNKKNDYMENFSLLSRKEERMNNSKTEKRVIDSPNNRPNMK